MRIAFEVEELALSLNLLQSQDLRIGQEKETCISLTQENSMENSVQNCLLYILKPHSLCYYYFGLP